MPLPSSSAHIPRRSRCLTQSSESIRWKRASQLYPLPLCVPEQMLLLVSSTVLIQEMGTAVPAQPMSQAEGVLRKTLSLKVFCNHNTWKQFPGPPGDSVQIQIPRPLGRFAAPPSLTAAQGAGTSPATPRTVVSTPPFPNRCPAGSLHGDWVLVTCLL